MNYTFREKVKVLNPIAFFPQARSTRTAPQEEIRVQSRAPTLSPKKKLKDRPVHVCLYYELEGY